MYVIIYGYRTKRWTMGQIQAGCQRCQRVARQQVVRSQRKFTLFWIPLFPIGTKTFMICTLCSNQVRVDNKQADAWFSRAPAQPSLPQGQFPGPEAPGMPATPQPGSPS